MTVMTLAAPAQTLPITGTWRVPHIPVAAKVFLINLAATIAVYALRIAAAITALYASSRAAQFDDNALAIVFALFALTALMLDIPALRWVRLAVASTLRALTSLVRAALTTTRQEHRTA